MKFQLYFCLYVVCVCESGGELNYSEIHNGTIMLHLAYTLNLLFFSFHFCHLQMLQMLLHSASD